MKYSNEDFTTETLNITDNLDKQDEVTASLAKLTGLFTETLVEGDTYEKKVAELTAENERLKAANMELYLKVTHTDKPKEDVDEGKKRSFDELFDEKGELK